MNNDILCALHGLHMRETGKRGRSLYDVRARRDVSTAAGPVDVYIRGVLSMGSGLKKINAIRTDILASGDGLVLGAGEYSEGVCTEVVTLRITKVSIY